MTRLGAAAGVVLLAPPVARAQCTVTVTPIAFGTYLPFAAAHDNTGTVTIACAFNAHWIALNAGVNGGSNFATAAWRAAAPSCSTSLHRRQRTRRSGATAQEAHRRPAPCPFCRRTHTVFGRIPARRLRGLAPTATRSW